MSVEEKNQLPWKIAFRVLFTSEKFGLKFHPAPLPDTGNGIYTIQLLDIPKGADPSTPGPAQQYNDSLKPEQAHLALRAGLYLTHINDTNLLNIPCELVIKQLTSIPRPVKLRFVDVDAGVVTLNELRDGKYGRNSLSETQIESLLNETEGRPSSESSQTPSTTQDAQGTLKKRPSIVLQSNEATNYVAEHVYKLILLGTTGVGKSSVLSVGIGGTTAFSDRPPATLEAEFGTMYVPDPDLSTSKMIKAQIWDTAGQERYRAMTRSHYRRADGALLVYDVADRESFEKLDGWLKDLRDVAGDSIKSIMVVENKVDQLPERTSETSNRPSNFVDEERVKEYCRSNGLLFARTSAKMNGTVYRWEGKPIHEVVSTLLVSVHATHLARGLKQTQSSDVSSIAAKTIVLENVASPRKKVDCGCN